MEIFNQWLISRSRVLPEIIYQKVLFWFVTKLGQFGHWPG